MLEPIDEIRSGSPRSTWGCDGDFCGAAAFWAPRPTGAASQGRGSGSGSTKYATHLRSLTQGRGGHGQVSHYEEVPRELAEKIIAAARAEKEAGAHA
jgi:hypothetical protein